MDKQQDPTAQHRKLYPIFYNEYLDENKYDEKNMKKNTYRYICN